MIPSNFDGAIYPSNQAVYPRILSPLLTCLFGKAPCNTSSTQISDSILEHIVEGPSQTIPPLDGHTEGKVSFNSKVTTLLIPTARELKIRHLKRVLWWEGSEFNRSSKEAKKEIILHQQETMLPLYLAIETLYQPDLSTGENTFLNKRLSKV